MEWKSWFAVYLLCFVVLMTCAWESMGQEIQLVTNIPPYWESLLFQLSDSTYLLTINEFESGDTEYDRPTVSAGRVAGEIVVGVVGGFGLAYSLGRATGSELLAIFGGYPLGSAIGVYGIGNIGDYTGSFEVAWLGSTIGLAVGVVSSWVLDFIYTPIAISAILVAPPIGAAIGFNKTRRYKSLSAAETALISISDEKVRIAVPTIAFRHDSFNRRICTQMVNLVRVKF